MPDALHTSSRGGLANPASTSSAELRRLLLVERVPQRLLRLSRFFSGRFWAPNKALHGVSAIHTERQVMVSGLRVNKDGQETWWEEESMRRPGWAGHMRLPAHINGKISIKSLGCYFLCQGLYAVTIPEMLRCLSQMRTWTLGL